MKIEIDLATLFCTDEADCTTEEAIKREIIDRLTGDMRKRLFARVDDELARAIQHEIKTVVEKEMPSLISDIMNATYTPVSNYGQRGEPTTFRAELIKAVGEQMKYAPKHYGSDENAFTRAVKAVVEEQTRAFRADFVARIDADFRKDALTYAVAELSKRLGLAK